MFLLLLRKPFTEPPLRSFSPTTPDDHDPWCIRMAQPSGLDGESWVLPGARMVGEDEIRLRQWSRHAALIAGALTMGSALVLLGSMLAGPPADARLDGTPADPAMAQGWQPMMTVQRPGMLPTVQPERVMLDVQRVGVLPTPQRGAMDLLQKTYGRGPSSFDLRVQFARTPSTWHLVRSGKTHMVEGDAPRNYGPARPLVQVVDGSRVTAQALTPDTVRLTVPPGQVVWAYPVATPHNAGTSPTISDPVVLRVGAVPPLAIEAKVTALRQQENLRLASAGVGLLALLVACWAVLCRFGMATARRDIHLLASHIPTAMEARISLSNVAPGSPLRG